SNSPATTADRVIIITINGTNDAPAITLVGGDSAASSLTETNADLASNGTLTVSDLDYTNTVVASVASVVASGITAGIISNNAALLAMLAVTPTNILSSTETTATLAWSFNSNGEAFNYLAAGENLVLTYVVRATDSSSTPGVGNRNVVITITGTNDAPVLADNNLTFSSVEDAAVPSGTVGSLISTLTGGVAEIDTTNTKGVAITALDITQGVWYYSTNSGTSWTLISSAPSASAALLLTTEARLYFKPVGNWNGVIDPAITLRAWDRTSGSNGGSGDTTTNGGTSAFSATSDTVALTVAAVNDAPTRLLSSVPLANANEDSATIATIANLFEGTGSNAAYTDATDQVIGTGSSSAQAMAGIVVVANASTATQGAWQYSADGSTGWTSIGLTVTTTNGLYLSKTYSLRFNPSANWNGTPGALTVRMADSSSTAPSSGATVNATGGGTTIYSDSNNSVTLVTTIVAVNDAPVASGTFTLAAVNEDALAPAGSTVSILFSGNFSDSTDTIASGSTANTLAGIAVTAYTSDAAKGEWQYSSDGTNWNSITSVSSAASSLTYASADRLRFLPALNFNGAAPTLTAVLIDSSSGASYTTGATLDVSSR
ncbi:MAG: VCBS domain-containing protein, partial [Acidobacteria bacterium]|nr:VCBS domain-containing protein [Acidobacteriota bacterium]